MVKKWRWATSFKHCPNSKLLNAMIHQWIKTGPQAISSDLAQTNSSLSLSPGVFRVRSFQEEGGGGKTRGDFPRELRGVPHQREL